MNFILPLANSRSTTTGTPASGNRAVATFPSIHIPSQNGGLPVEVELITKLGHGAGTQAFESATARQRAHPAFVEALDEPSARRGAMNLAHGDRTSLYSFGVGAKGHPFHRHAGHRVFTAISGSGGATLRFSSASAARIERDPASFVESLHQVNIPPDCVFTVRFGGDTWHQFAPSRQGSSHPALFALSCHTNELGGSLSRENRERVLANQASIPTLTELLPDNVEQLLKRVVLDPTSVATTTLSLDAPAGSLHAWLCRQVRGIAGQLRGAWARRARTRGFLSSQRAVHTVQQLETVPEGSLLRTQYREGPLHHEDTFKLLVDDRALAATAPLALLADLLEGFLVNQAAGVTRLMQLRNALVRPLRLRTSPLGCPVSSLLSPRNGALFADRYPVHDQRVDTDGSQAQVILGADDKHICFRSCVGVQRLENGLIAFTLGTRVQYRNRFGRFYMAMIDGLHRNYAAPALLSAAVEHVLTVASMRRDQS